MFNPERLLGSMLGKSSSSLLAQAGRGVGVSGKTGALALLGGVAFAAFEHFSQQKTKQTGAQPPPHAPPGPILSGPGASVPPPPPMAPPPPPPIAASAPADPAKTAVLLVRAMIAAAKADGVIDNEERRRIFERLADASEEERDFVRAEMDKPLGLDELLAGVDLDPVLAIEIYTASLLAIELDTSAEVKYLKALARRLGLDEATVNRIHSQLGVIQIFA